MGGASPGPTTRMAAPFPLTLPTRNVILRDRTALPLSTASEPTDQTDHYPADDDVFGVHQ